MKKPKNIYTVEANEIARKTYKIQATTEDEALQNLFLFLRLE